MKASGVTKPKSDLVALIAWFLAALLFGAVIVAIVLPRKALPW